MAPRPCCWPGLTYQWCSTKTMPAFRRSTAQPLTSRQLRKDCSISASSLSGFRIVPKADVEQLALRRSNRKKVNSTTDECPDDRTVNADVLKVAAQNQFK